MPKSCRKRDLNVYKFDLSFFLISRGFGIQGDETLGNFASTNAQTHDLTLWNPHNGFKPTQRMGDFLHQVQVNCMKGFDPNTVWVGCFWLSTLVWDIQEDSNFF